MGAQGYALIALAVVQVALVVLAAFRGWLKPFFTDQNGAFSSVLFWRNVWQLAILDMVLYQTVTSGVDATVLGFAAGMAGVGEAVYNWRRGQDRKLDAERLKRGAP